MPTNKYTFNVILNPEEAKQLVDLSQGLRTSRGAVVRRLIAAAYAHTISEIPTCADGSRCFVPQMHVRPKPPTTNTP